MKPAEIDLFVDRLCSFWPTTNIARNTLKNGWKHSEIIIDATAEHAKQVLADCKPLPKFPDLNASEAELLDGCAFDEAGVAHLSQPISVS